MQLFYNPNLSEQTSEFTFSEEESKHIVRVLRKKELDTLSITNGKGLLFAAEITLANAKRCNAKVIALEKKHKKKNWLHIAVAPTKNNDRYEWFLEKATEIGVDEITPIICDHSERKIIKQERLEKVIQSAMKQSLQCYLPKFNSAISYKDFIKKEHQGLLFIAHCEKAEKVELKRRAAADKDITILIGPEGDFSTTEIKKAYNSNFLPVSLGENRLRTETAALVACTTVAMINQ
ncbi:16S rRNA (uracil(1498)-N(3))-methyltransferase [uncultured Maribacter sp.]|uniref:16S rRNA (uracil(1498)-N(3))-methyltransferase n=1 Tax=uncultured Maribacter sp. TaxID=431308 RepID=UPI002615F040|nr:16S rRNA (uracil(1498)-N(3))-methyltransferase [uncultured Maribacter sp.]